MTCIVGMEYRDQVFMGGDSMSSDGYTKSSISYKKVFVKKAKIHSDVIWNDSLPFLIGYTTSFRMGQLIEFTDMKFDIQIRPSKPFEFMVVWFVPALRQLLKEGGYSRIENNVENGGQFLVGFMRKLFVIDSDFQVNHFARGYHAVGSGAQFVLGAIYQHKQSAKEYPPQDTILKALEASGEFSTGVCPPYYVESL